MRANNDGEGYEIRDGTLTSAISVYDMRRAVSKKTHSPPGTF